MPPGALSDKAIRAPLTVRSSGGQQWLEANVEVTDPLNPFRATATRPLPGRPSSIRHDSVFIRLNTRTPSGELETVPIYSGEPDPGDVMAPAYRVSMMLENHSGDSRERDFTVNCALRCDGGGTTPIEDPPVNVAAEPVQSRPRVTHRCNIFGGEFGGTAQNPGMQTADRLVEENVNRSDNRLRSAVPLHHMQGTAEALADYDITFLWLEGRAPAARAQHRFRASAGVTRGAVLSAPVDGKSRWDNPSSRLQIGNSSDPRSFTIDCRLDFAAPWAF